MIGRGLAADLLLLSGGVSAGKYDVVEEVLAEFGAEFYFDRVLIQPGQPLVFGRAGGKFFFGLPGNPSSTMVTFEIFARAALELLAGQEETHAAFAAGAPDSRFPPSHRADPLSAGALERRRQRSDAGQLARLRRYSGADPRQCLSGGRSRSRRLCARRTHTDTLEMKKLSHYDSAGSARMVDVSAKQETRRTARAHAFVRIAPAVLRKLPRESQRQSARDRAHRRDRGRQTHQRPDSALPSADADPRRCRGDAGEERACASWPAPPPPVRPASKWRR